MSSRICRDSARTAIALVLLLMETATPVVAADITTVPLSGGLWGISIIGELENGDDQKFRNTTYNIQKAIVFLKSPGGNLPAGLSIGTQINQKRFSTAVISDGICASACALAWLGGEYRSISPIAKVGFHAAYTESGSNSAVTSSGNALVGAYLDRLGINDSAIFLLTAASPSDMHWLTESDAKALKISVIFTDMGDTMLKGNYKTAGLAVMIASLAAPSAYSADPLSKAVQQGYDHGFHDCARALDFYVRFVHKDDLYADLGQWATTLPNNKMFSSTTSAPFPGGNAITTFSASKNTAGKCDVTFTEVFYSQESCLKIRENTFKDWKYYRDLAGSAVLEDSTDVGDDIILTNTPNNTCLVVKHEVATDVAPG